MTTLAGWDLLAGLMMVVGLVLRSFADLLRRRRSCK
jgi:hypothetical protein